MLVLKGARGSVDEVGFAAGGGLIARVVGGVQFWRAWAAGGPPEVAVPLRSGVCSARLFPDGRRAVLGGYGRYPAVLDLATVGLPVVVPADLRAGVPEPVPSPDGRHLVVGTQTGGTRPERRLWCRPTADLSKTTWSVPVRRGFMTPPVFLTPTAALLVEVDFDLAFRPVGWVYVVRDGRTGDTLTEAPADGDHLFSRVVAAPDGRFVVGLLKNGRMMVVRPDAPGAEPVLVQNDTPRHFTGVAYHPSGRYLAATSNDATVKLYDTATWAVAKTYTWNVGRLRSVAFSPDGTLAAAGSDTGRVVVWDVDT
jgi:WD40 repeat protein